MKTSISLSMFGFTILLALTSVRAFGQISSADQPTFSEITKESAKICYQHGQERERLQQKRGELQKQSVLTPKSAELVSLINEFITKADAACHKRSSAEEASQSPFLVTVRETASACYQYGQYRERLRVMNEGLQGRPNKTDADRREIADNEALLEKADRDCIKQ